MDDASGRAAEPAPRRRRVPASSIRVELTPYGPQVATIYYQSHDGGPLDIMRGRHAWIAVDDEMTLRGMRRAILAAVEQAEGAPVEGIRDAITQPELPSDIPVGSE